MKIYLLNILLTRTWKWSNLKQQTQQIFYLIDCLQRTLEIKTPYEAWFNSKPKLKSLKVFEFFSYFVGEER